MEVPLRLFSVNLSGPILCARNKCFRNELMIEFWDVEQVAVNGQGFVISYKEISRKRQFLHLLIVTRQWAL